MSDATTTQSPPRPWSLPARVGFRFALLYVALYALIPDQLWEPVVPTLGELVGVEVVYLPNGSGDTTYGYVLVFARLALVLIATSLWSVLDREREASPRLAEWFVVGTRYYLASVMISYGLGKVFLLQFAPPRLAQLVEPFGDFSPMGLAWTFVGFSHAYQFFGGALEIIGGLLLLSRRTTTLGALVCAGVMANVVMLNYCFDIPVKLFSSHLLVFALGLAALDGRRLLDSLVLNRATERVEHPPHFESRKLHVAGRVVKGLVIVAMIVPTTIMCIHNLSVYGLASPRSPLYGIYEVVEMREDGELRPGLVDDDGRWRHMIFEHPALMQVQLMDGSFVKYETELDLDAGTMVVTQQEGEVFDRFLIEPPEPVEPSSWEWTVTALGPGQYVLTGELDGHELELHLVASELDFLLTSRGFHWINETPLNR